MSFSSLYILCSEKKKRANKEMKHGTGLVPWRKTTLRSVGRFNMSAYAVAVHKS